MDGFDRLASDTTSSATTLFSSAETLLRESRGAGPAALRQSAVRICRAQPSMAALWNLAAAALAGDAAFDTFTGRARRAPAAAARVATTLLAGDARRVLTCSRSALVEMTVKRLRVPSVCAESGPGREGRALAESLAREGLPVTLVTDAAIASGFEAGDVVLVGADAVSAGWFINKTGTGQLCAAASLAGVPAYVISGREKFVPRALATELTLREDDPGLVWESPPPGVTVVNPLFERVSIDRVAAVITDAGVLAGGMIEAACESSAPEAGLRELLGLMRILPDRGKAG